MTALDGLLSRSRMNGASPAQVRRLVESVIAKEAVGIEELVGIAPDPRHNTVYVVHRNWVTAAEERGSFKKKTIIQREATLTHIRGARTTLRPSMSGDGNLVYAIDVFDGGDSRKFVIEIHTGARPGERVDERLSNVAEQVQSLILTAVDAT